MIIFSNNDYHFYIMIIGCFSRRLIWNINDDYDSYAGLDSVQDDNNEYTAGPGSILDQ